MKEEGREKRMVEIYFTCSAALPLTLLLFPAVKGSFASVTCTRDLRGYSPFSMGLDTKILLTIGLETGKNMDN